jgi:bifunctional NMN adenylyltransferase/nudix hydrolase
MKYKLAVFIGRFQPFHNAHKSIVDMALEKAERVLILVGSSEEARSSKNPFTFEERSEVIRAIFPDACKVTIEPLPDNPYNEEGWIENVKTLVRKHSGWTDKLDNGIALVGHASDSSSYYLKHFPEWDFIDSGENVNDIHASKIRSILFDPFSKTIDRVLEYVPLQTSEFLKKFYNTDIFYKLKKEHSHVTFYCSGFGYPTIYVTADCLVKYRNKFLFIKRKSDYGNGLIAIPGGFVDQNETVLQSAIRELKEETKISVSVEDLAAYSKKVFLADYPSRDLRARIISQVILFDIPPYDVDGKNINISVQANDDAQDVLWLTVGNFYEKKQSEFFADHFHVINQIILGDMKK